MQNTNVNRMNNVNFLRFLFCLFIVLFHILHPNILPYTRNIPAYSFLAQQVENCAYIVECFFLIGGFFLYKTVCCRIHELSLFQVGLKKYFRLMPALLPSILGLMVFQHGSLESILTALSDICLLRCVGVTFDCTGINWYVSPFFYGSLFYCFLFAVMQPRAACFLTAVLSGASFTFLVNYGQGLFLRETACYGFSMGLLRAFGGLGAGILLCVLLDKMKDFQDIFFPNGKLRSLIFSIIELGIAALLLKILLGGGTCPNKFYIVLLFAILFACFTMRFGIVSRLCDQKLFFTLGQYTYSIYVMQQICFVLLGFSLWRTPLIQHPAYCIAISLVFCSLTGIVVYYLIERPCSRWIAAKLKSKQP